MFIRVINQIKKILPQNEAIGFEVVKAIYRSQYELSRK